MASTCPCPPPSRLEQMLADALEGTDAEDVEAHVADCAECQMWLEVLTRGTEPGGDRTEGGLGSFDPEFLERLAQRPPEPTFFDALATGLGDGRAARGPSSPPPRIPTTRSSASWAGAAWGSSTGPWPPGSSGSSP